LPFDEVSFDLADDIFAGLNSAAIDLPTPALIPLIP
jgi:hypothetical protein